MVPVSIWEIVLIVDWIRPLVSKGKQFKAMYDAPQNAVFSRQLLIVLFSLCRHFPSPPHFFLPCSKTGNI